MLLCQQVQFWTLPPAMREEYFGNIYAKAEDNAGNMSDAIFARFMFEQTEPVAEKTLTPDHWTNGTVEIDLSTDDNLSGVQDITLPDGNIVDAAQAKPGYIGGRDRPAGSKDRAGGGNAAWRRRPGRDGGLRLQ